MVAGVASDVEDVIRVDRDRRVRLGGGMAGNAVRVTDEGGVRRLTFCRPDAYNTITPELRDELGDALDAASRPATSG